MIRKFLAVFVIRVTGEALGSRYLDKRDSFYKNLARQGARLDAFAQLA